MCGISLIARTDDAVPLCISILQRLQHRGQQGAKIVYGTLAEPDQFTSHGGLGKIEQVFSFHSDKPSANESVNNQWCIGHTRYTTYSKRSHSRSEDLQPFVMETLMGTIILVHNGQLGGSSFECSQHRQSLMERGYSFSTESDTELLFGEISLMQQSNIPFEDILVDALDKVKGSASIAGAIINGKNISWFGARKQGNRPLFMGTIKNEGRDGYVFTSEDYMLSEHGVTDIHEVDPFSCVFIDYSGNIKTIEVSPDRKEKSPRHCIFELFYFSYPLSTFRGTKISQLRKEFGKALYKAHRDMLEKVGIDVVMSVPDSGNHAALGFSHASGIPLDYGILRNHFAGRSFIEQINQREQKAKQKYSIDGSVVQNKHIAIIDDSVVRSTTARVLVKKLREHQPKSISFLVASPPIKYPNYYGIDIQDGMIAANFDSVEDIAKDIGIDYLGYLDLEKTVQIVSEITKYPFNIKDFCTCCFSGKLWHTNLK
jgi:amidophosphoribosyltransferase